MSRFVYVPFKSNGEISSISADISTTNDISAFVDNKITAMSVDARLSTLSSNIMTAVGEISTTVVTTTLTSYDATYDISSLYPLSNHNTGDIAIIKRPISADHYEYSTYVANKNLSVWEPMTGSYNAKNVYFSDDIVITQPFGKYKPTTSNPRLTLSSANKSVWDIFYDSLHVAESGTTTQPKLTLTTNTPDLTGYYTQTIPDYTATYKFSAGSYTYGPSPTGSKVETNNAHISSYVDSTSLTTTSNSTVLNNNNQITLTISGQKFAEGNKTLKFSSEGQWLSANPPFDSLGSVDKDTSKYITAGTQPLTSVQKTFTGSLPFWYAFADSNEIVLPVDNELKANVENMTINGIVFKRDVAPVSGKSFTITAGFGWNWLLVIVPKDRFTSWTAISKGGIPAETSTTKPEQLPVNVKITHYDGTTVGEYTIFRSYSAGKINPDEFNVIFS